MDMSNLYVTRVTGDRTFYVAASETDTANETLVILNEEPSPGRAGESRARSTSTRDSASRSPAAAWSPWATPTSPAWG